MAELYAIVGSLQRARFMLQGRVPYVQLRLKGQPLTPLESEIRELVRAFPASKVVINDDLDFAVRVGAWGVHLGQEDLARYAPETVRGAPVRVGISSHSDEEIAHALSYQPALLGFGPIYPTDTKALKHAPQGLERLRQVVSRITLPIAAIGGIGEDTLEEVARTGVALVAMIGYLDRITRPHTLERLIRRLNAPCDDVQP